MFLTLSSTSQSVLLFLSVVVFDCGNGYLSNIFTFNECSATMFKLNRTTHNSDIGILKGPKPFGIASNNREIFN